MNFGWFQPKRRTRERARFRELEDGREAVHREQRATVAEQLADRRQWIRDWEEAGLEPPPASHRAGQGSPLGRWGEIASTNLEGGQARPPGGWAEIQGAHRS